MTCVGCGKDLYSVGEYVLCQRCNGVLCRSNQCNVGGCCSDRWACDSRAIDQWEMKAAVEAAEKHLTRREDPAVSNRCPDCGSGAVVRGEGMITCSSCGHSEVDTRPL